MSSNTNIFNFKGQVKVADVQDAFNDIISRLNNIITTYNTTNTFLEEQDFSIGGESLGASGYTLTIGGIKQVLRAYNGTVFGCRAFRLSNNRIFVTDGILITTAKPIRIHSTIIATGSGTVLYYNPETEQIERSESGDTIPEGCIFVTYLSTSNTDIYANCFRGLQLEGLSGFSISIKDRQIPQAVEEVPASKPHRFEGGGAYWADGSSGGHIRWKDITQIARAIPGSARRAHATCMPANFLFVPKGCDSPLTTAGGYITKVIYTMIFKRGDPNINKDDNS